MKPSLFCLAGLLFGSQSAFCSPIDLMVNVGGVNYLESTSFTLWPTIELAAGGGFTVSSPAPNPSIWLNLPTTYGLTNTLFTCRDSNGCTGFVFSFTLLGESVANLLNVDIRLKGIATGGSFDAEYLVSCASSSTCPIVNPVGGIFPLSGDFSSVGVGGTANMILLGPLPTPAPLVNYQVFWNIQPSGGGKVPFNTTLSLPSSLDITETPEPAMGMLVGFGLAGIFALRRKTPSKC